MYKSTVYRENKYLLLTKLCILQCTKIIVVVVIVGMLNQSKVKHELFENIMMCIEIYFF